MNDMELAEEIEQVILAGNKVGIPLASIIKMGFTLQQWSAIIAALRCGHEPVPRLCPGSSQPAEFFGSPLGIGTCGICKRTVNISASGLTNTHPYEPERPPSGEMVMVPRVPMKAIIMAMNEIYWKLAERPKLTHGGNVYVDEYAATIYRAMLFAAEASKEAK